MQNFKRLNKDKGNGGEPVNSEIIGRYPEDSAVVTTPSGFTHKQQQDVEGNHAKSGNVMANTDHDATESGTARVGTKILGPVTAEPSQRARLLTWTMECKQWQKQPNQRAARSQSTRLHTKLSNQIFQ